MNNICKNDINTEFWGQDRCNAIVVVLILISIPLFMTIKGCENMSPIWWSRCNIIWISLIIIAVYLYQLLRVEGFGSTSPGTMVQLQTSHVPTDKYIYPKLVQKEIYNMSG